MTHDRKGDSKSSKEMEKSSAKKTDSSAPVNADKTTSSAEGLPTKVIMQCSKYHGSRPKPLFPALSRTYNLLLAISNVIQQMFNATPSFCSFYSDLF